MRSSVPGYTSVPWSVGGVSAGAVTAGGATSWRITSGSSTSRSTRKRAQRRSPCHAVTVSLAKVRPSWIDSTASSVGASMRPGRAKIDWIDRTALPGWRSVAVTIAWARNWPPNTTSRWSASPVLVTA